MGGPLSTLRFGKQHSGGRVACTDGCDVTKKARYIEQYDGFAGRMTAMQAAGKRGKMQKLLTVLTPLVREAVAAAVVAKQSAGD